MIEPKFRIDDVLQTTLFSPAQQAALQVMPYFDWFREAVKPFEDSYVKLAVVAEGIETDPQWVQFIKDHPKWEVQCHGWEHKIMHRMEEEDIYRELKKAKELIENTFQQQVTQFYPPKHYFGENMFRACSRLRLSLMLDRAIPDRWFENKLIPEVYFHFWNLKQIAQAEEILKLCPQ